MRRSHGGGIVLAVTGDGGNEGGVTVATLVAVFVREAEKQ